MKTSLRLPRGAATLILLALTGCSASSADSPDGQGGAAAGNPGGGAGIAGNGGVPGGYGGVPGGYGGVPGGNGGVPGGNGGAPPGGFGGVAGSAGISPGGSAGAGAIGGMVDPVGNMNRAPGFINLAPPMGAPLPAMGTALTPPPPAGWQWHPIDGAICRDGSPLGIFVRQGTAGQLLIYMEGGGACSNVPFCRFNPKSVNEILAGDGSNVLGSAGGAIAGRQQPGGYSAGTPAGIFDPANTANPFRDWSMVYIPYCTGDVHAGTRANATVPGTPGADARDLMQHQFVGYRNMEKIIGRVQPTFASATRVVVTGVSAGSFGAAVNFSMIQDSFGNTPVTVIGDSGVPFNDQYMPACMQRSWRDTWGLALPPDCTECQQADGGGLLGMADFLMRKHPVAKVALVSTMEDEVIRLFFSVGLQNCANIATADPVAIFLGGADPNVFMAAAQYSGGLNAVRTQYQATNRLATYYMPGLLHQHLFRPSFYTLNAGSVPLPQFVTNFLSGTVAQVGP